MREREPRGWAMLWNLLMAVGIFGVIFGGVTMLAAVWALVREP